MQDTRFSNANKAFDVEQNGVHWGWWVVWGLVFLPSLIVVAMIHNGRKQRAAIRQQNLERTM